MPVYIKIEGIDGEATETNHKKWIEAHSFASPIHRRVPDGSFGKDAIDRGSLNFGNIFIRRKVDSSSVPLAKGAALGTVHKTVEVHLTTPLGSGEQKLVEYKLSDAILTSHSIEVMTEPGKPQTLGESAEINFAKIEWKQYAYGTDGKLAGTTSGWYDRKTSTGG